MDNNCNYNNRECSQDVLQNNSNCYSTIHDVYLMNCYTYTYVLQENDSIGLQMHTAYLFFVRGNGGGGGDGVLSTFLNLTLITSLLRFLFTTINHFVRFILQTYGVCKHSVYLVGNLT